MIDRLSATASIAVRHLGAYADLIASDLDLTSRELRRQLLAAAVMALGTLLAAGLACVLVIAAAWDTQARLWVIGGLTAAAALVAGVALLRLRNAKAGAAPLLAQTTREWDKDRQLLEELLERDGAEKR